MKSLGTSFTSSGTRIFLLIAILQISEWSNVVSASEYQRSESYTGSCHIEDCGSTCETEGFSGGGKCRRGHLLQLRSKCYCVISPDAGADEDAGAGAGAGAGSVGSAANAATTGAGAGGSVAAAVTAGIGALAGALGLAPPAATNA